MAEGQKITDQPETSIVTHVLGAADIGGEANLRKQAIAALAAQLAQYLGGPEIMQPTFVELRATRGFYEGQKGSVGPGDSASHNDFVPGSSGNGYTGSSVLNSSLYSWTFAGQGGWRWAAPYGETIASRVSQISSAAAGGPSAYTATVAVQPQTKDFLIHTWNAPNSGPVTLALSGGPAIQVRAGRELQNLRAGDIIAGQTDLLIRHASLWQIVGRNITNEVVDNVRDAAPYEFSNMSPEGAELQRLLRDKGVRENAFDHEGILIASSRALVFAGEDADKPVRGTATTAFVDVSNFQIWRRTGEIRIPAGSTLTVNFSPIRATQISTTATVTSGSPVIDVASAAGVQMWMYCLVNDVPNGMVVGISGTSITLDQAVSGADGSRNIRFSPVPDLGPMELWSVAPGGAVTAHPSTVRQLRFTGPATIQIVRDNPNAFQVYQRAGIVPNWATEALTTAPAARSRSIAVGLGASLEVRVDSQSGRSGWRRLWSEQEISKDFFPINSALGSSSILERTDGNGPNLYWVSRTRSGSGWTYSAGRGLAQMLRLMAAAVADGQPAPTTCHIGIGGIESRIIAGFAKTVSVANSNPVISVSSASNIAINQGVYINGVYAGIVIGIAGTDITLSENYAGANATGVAARFVPFRPQDVYDAYKYAIDQIKAAYSGIRFFMTLLPFGDGRAPVDGDAFAWRAIQLALATNTDVHLAAPIWELPQLANDLHITGKGTDIQGYLNAQLDARIMEGKTLPRGPYLSTVEKVSGSDGYEYTVLVHRGGNGPVYVPDFPEGFAFIPSTATSYETATPVFPTEFRVTTGPTVDGEPTLMLRMKLPSNGGETTGRMTLAYPWTQSRLQWSRRGIRSQVVGFAGYELPLNAFCDGRYFLTP